MPVFFFTGPAAAPALPLVLVHGDRFDTGSDNDQTAITYTPVGHQAGDVVFAIIHNDGGTGRDMSSTPPGATLISSDLNNGAARSRAYRVDLSGGEGTLTWTLAQSDQIKADFITVRNTDPTTPIPAGGVVEDSKTQQFSSITLPSATVGRAGSWFFHSMTNDQDSSTIALSSWPAEVSQSGPDERRVDDIGENFSLSQYSALEIDLAAGSTGDRTYTIASNDSMQTIGIVIQPAEGSSGGGSPTPPSQIADIPGAFARIESGVTGNNTNA